MTLRDELTILQQAIQKSFDYGFLAEESQSILGIDIVLDPPSLVVSRRGGLDDSPLYFDPLFPLFESGWALAFWGNDLIGDAYFGLLPAWKYHQHKLLELLQNGEKEEFYKYIQLYL